MAGDFLCKPGYFMSRERERASGGPTHALAPRRIAALVWRLRVILTTEGSFAGKGVLLGGIAEQGLQKP